MSVVNVKQAEIRKEKKMLEKKEKGEKLFTHRNTRNSHLLAQKALITTHTRSYINFCSLATAIIYFILSFQVASRLELRALLTPENGELSTFFPPRTEKLT